MIQDTPQGLQVERFNQTLESILRKRIEEDGLVGNWDQDLPGALLAYNSSRHSTTGVSPYRAVLGQEPTLPSDPAHEDQANDARTMTSAEFAQYLTVKNEARRKLHERMMVKIKDSQEKMWKYHQRRNASPEYSVGDKVLMRNKRRDDRKGNKLETTWSSTIYTIDAIKGRNTYYVSSNGIRLKKMIKACHFKKCNV